MGIEEKYFEYLRSVNPIAQKIAEDIDIIKESNKNCWSSLDPKSKEKIIDDALIDCSLVQRYDDVTFEPEYEDFGPISSFSWFSRSQLNLFTHFNVRPDKAKTPMKKTDILSPQKKTKSVTVKSEIATKQHVRNKSSRDEKTEKVCTKGVAKPKTPPPPPPAKLVVAEQKGLLEDSQSLDDIPKTGFDFLDNW